MQKLVCFGDSYIAGDLERDSPGLTPLAKQLAAQLDLPLLNFGASGSGLSCSIDRFYRYLASSDYESTDYIFFNTTHHHRMWFPQSGGDFFIFPDSLAKTKETDGNRFFKKNLREINWALENLSYELEHDILHVVRTMAYQALRGNRCLVINAFELSPLCLELCQKVPGSKRFRNLMFREGLVKTSVGEFDNEEAVDWPNEHKYQRINHYSQMNVNRLAEQFAAEFNGQSAFDPSQLKQGFIKT